MNKYHLAYLSSAIAYYDGHDVEPCTGVIETYEVFRRMNPLRRAYYRLKAKLIG